MANTAATSHSVRPRVIAIIAGPKSHGYEGNGIHDYLWDARAMVAMLQRSNVSAQVRVRCHEGWPEDPTALDDVDAVVVHSDGRDGDIGAEALHICNGDRIAQVEHLAQRGCGIATLHFTTFAPIEHATRVLDWCGGYFRWQDDDGKRAWRSAITTLEASVEPTLHPAARGLTTFRLREEFYHRIELAADAKPVLRVPALGVPGDVVAWARERSDGGRGFGATLGHFHTNWQSVNFRRMVLNAIVWVAKRDVPAGGVRSFLER